MKERESFYALSVDYELLYKKLLLGYEVVGFVDYNFRSLEGKSPPQRDVCKIRRKGAYDIDFGCRGMSYGGIYGSPQDELTAFISECNRMNLEWII